MTGIAYARPADLLPRWVGLLDAVGIPNPAEIGSVARVIPARLRGDDVDHPSLWRYEEVEARWYASLAAGSPDWTVYDDPWYLPDLWGCWVVYSRAYLRALDHPDRLGIVGETLGPVRRIVDLGCGFGFTTAALAQAFPGSTATGTNLRDTVQWDAATEVGRRFGFDLSADLDEIDGPVDLAFASEFYEHFIDPVAYLDDVVSTLAPRGMIVANSFCTTSVGHFPAHRIGGEETNGRETHAAFRAAVEGHGYRKVPTTMWNDRPQFYVRDEQEPSR